MPGDSMCMLTLGTGVGAGIILNRKIWHGMIGMGGEGGHIPWSRMASRADAAVAAAWNNTPPLPPSAGRPRWRRLAGAAPRIAKMIAHRIQRQGNSPPAILLAWRGMEMRSPGRFLLTRENIWAWHWLHW